jgi:biopolymer transport protein ExbD
MASQAMELKVASLNRVYGPVTMEKLVHLATAGRISAHDMVRRAGTADWLLVTDVPALAASLPHRATVDELEQEIEPSGGYVSTRGRWQWGDVEMDMTPMIDVTFQLLIFFMITHAMANPPPMDVPEVRHGRGVTIEGQQLVLVDQEGRYYLGDRAAEENASPSLDELIREVRQNARQGDQVLDVIISAHKKAKHGRVREVIERLGEVEGLGRVVIGVEEKMK